MGRPVRPAQADPRLAARRNRLQRRPGGARLGRPRDGVGRHRLLGSARRHERRLGARAAGADHLARRCERGRPGRRAQLDDLQPRPRDRAGQRRGRDRDARHSVGVRPQLALVPRARRRPAGRASPPAALCRPCVAAREHRPGVGRAPARDVAADRDVRRFRVRSGEHRIARVRARRSATRTPGRARSSGCSASAP